MLGQLWSFAERFAPRVVSALLLLLLAYFASPEAVGVYNYGILLYTLFQALTDAPFRQVIFFTVSSRKGMRFLRRYRILVAILGFLGILLGILVIRFVLDVEHPEEVLTLLPIAFAPAFTAMGLRGVGLLQAAGKWKTLAAGQAVAAVSSLAVALPALYLSHSPLGCSLGLLTTELVFAFWCWRKGCSVVTSRVEIPRDSRRISSLYTKMAGYSGLAWSQGQADRVLIGGFSGAANLGIFSMATALARSLGDALASSSANVLRSELGTLTNPEDAHQRASRILNRGTFLALVGVWLSVLMTQTVVTWLLGEEWRASLAIVPLLSLSVIPSVFSWSSAVLHVARRSAGRALIAPIIGILFAVPIAWLSATNLLGAAGMVLFRELSLSCVAYLLIGRTAPWRSYGYGMLAVAGSLAVMVVTGLVPVDEIFAS